jgi:reverse gyrase
MTERKIIQKNYRVNHLEEYRERDRIRMQQKRQAMNEKQKDEDRRKARERMKTKRVKVSNVSEESTVKQPLTPQTLGKAVARANRALPHQKYLRIAVLQELCQREDLTVMKRQPSQFTNNCKRDELYTMVEVFYARDDISRQSPGLKDTCYVKELKMNVSFYYSMLFSSYLE